MLQEKIFYQKTNRTFTDFYKEYKDKLIWYLMKMKPDINCATEIADTAFISSLEQIEKYDETKGQVSTWIFTNARHLMLAHIKNKQRAITDYLFDGEQEGNAIVDTLICQEDNRELYFEIVKKKVDILKTSIYKLEKMYRTPLVLCYLDGLSYQEISDYLDININTIKSRIRNGKLLLSKELNLVFEQLDYELCD